MHDGDDEERIEAGSKTLPADNQSAVLALKPCARPFSLKARHALFDRSAAWPPSLPHPFRDLGANPACAEALAESLGIISLISRHDLEPFTWSTPLARTDVDGIQQGDDLGPLVAIRGRGTRR
jgi:hypothetical protein